MGRPIGEAGGAVKARVSRGTPCPGRGTMFHVKHHFGICSKRTNV